MRSPFRAWAAEGLRSLHGRPSGTVVLLATVIVLASLDRAPILSPPELLFIPIVYSGLTDTRWRAAIVTTVAVIYAAVALSSPNELFSYTDAAGIRLVTLALLAPPLAWMTMAVKAQVDLLTVERAARRAAEAERDFVRRILDSSPTPILVLDPQNARVDYASLAAARTLDRPIDEIEGVPTRDVLGDVAGAVRELTERVRTTGGPAQARDAAYQPRDGPTRYLDLAAGPLAGRSGIVLAMVDVTERRQAEQEAAEARRQALQSEKLAALGTLISGVAHEIRSPLTVAQNHVSLAAEASARAAKGGRADDITLHLSGIQASLDRVNAMVRELRRFTRGEVGVRSTESLAPSVRHALGLFRIAHRGKIRIEARLQETPAVQLDRGQIEQVVLNLLENASAASAAGGLVELEVTHHEGGARLRVRDHGIGMEPAVRDRIFEPFFTTKSEGTGLGLSIVRRIVETHSGEITCDTAPGRGSTFTIDIPAPGRRLVPISATAP